MTSLPLSFNACNGGFNSTLLDMSTLEQPSSHDSSQNTDNLSVSEQVFFKTVYPVLNSNCSQCHGVFQNPLFAVKDVKSSHSIIMTRKLVDLKDPSGSYFLKKLNLGHNGFSKSLIDELEKEIKIWANTLEVPSESNPPIANNDFASSTPISILNKIKFLTNGAALTETELKTYATKTNDLTSMRTLINSWINTPEGEAKIKFYLMNALNQDIDVNPDSIVTGVESRSGPGASMESNMRESFARTALDIINRNRSFAEILTTKRFAVTTGLLSSYAYMDRRDKGGARITQAMRTDTTGDDFRDWRFITFEQSDALPATYKDFDYFRKLKDGDTIKFGIPRIGFYSTPAFIGKYPSNDDNQFRVTINQTLIGGLGKTFSPADKTNQPNLVHLDPSHSDPKSDCFQCHRSMDPMREIFGRNMTYGYRFKSDNREPASSFAFFGQIKPLTKLEDLSNAIATHEDFNIAWAQKICVALNTKRCVETDMEFLRIANLFKISGYNFKTLYVEMLLSALTTGATSTTTTSISGFDVARSRKYHFCHNMNARQRQIQAARGVAISAFDEGRNICGSNDAIDSIGNDHTVRGYTDVVNSFPTDAIARQGLERSCYILAGRLLSLKNTFDARTTALTQNVDLITEYIAGIPKSHPRSQDFKNALITIHDYNINSLKMTFTNSLRELITFGCVSPDSIGVGL